MVGIVLVSHSVTLAEGLRVLAASMAQGCVRIAVAAGLEDDDTVLGTDPLRIQRAVEEAWSEDGVLVLMDLGSALLSAEMALEMLPDEQRQQVRLCAAPLVEGAVAAVAHAAGGHSLAQVEAEALSALAGKATHLGVPGPAAGEGTGSARSCGDTTTRIAMRAVVRDPFGLHARPAARLVAVAARCPGEVEISNLTRATGPVSARSINQVMTLGIRRGDEIEFTAEDDDSGKAHATLRSLVESLDAQPAAAVPPPPALPPAAGTLTGPAVAGAGQGLPASPGIAVGRVRRWHAPEHPQPDDAAEPAQEAWTRLQRALAAAETELSTLQAHTTSRAGREAAEVLAAHRLLLQDPLLLERARSLVLGEARSAHAAWKQALDEVRATWSTVDDPYLRERVADLDDVAARVGRLLSRNAEATGPLAPQDAAERPAPACAAREEGCPGDPAPIVVATDLAPSTVASLHAGTTAGLCLAGGTPLSHASILARALGIPAVVGVGAALLEAADGTLLALDGDRGLWWLDPDPDTLEALREEQRQRAVAGQLAREKALAPAQTREGLAVAVRANVGSGAPADLEALRTSGADGVGLLRTEFLFLGRATPPSEEEQVAAYRAVVDAAGRSPVVIRTVDIGGDKPVPYLECAGEANPFLGWRGIRQSLDLPSLLETQVRAILRAGADQDVRVMFPMVASLREVRSALEAVARARASLARDGLACGKVECGVMIEVPAAALMADQWAPLVDFFSIGTNDLTQYVMAADRTHPRLGALLDPLDPAVLRLVARAARAAGEQGIPVAVCGEVAADPVALPLLLGLGVTELSVAPREVAAVKARVRRWSIDEARTLAAQALQADTPASVRALVPGR